jgi:hypothetical protein
MRRRVYTGIGGSFQGACFVELNDGGVRHLRFGRGSHSGMNFVSDVSADIVDI